MLDLTPFGFTPTETQAYQALLELGPSTGYAVARALSIARANAYQALDGLVAKQAAVLLADQSPRRYRAMQPRSVFATLVDVQTRRLDELEQQLLAQPDEGARPIVLLHGERAVMDTVVRTVVRAAGPITLVAPADRLAPLAPALRARAAAARPIEVWAVGGGTEELPLEVRSADVARFAQFFPARALLLVADGALVASFGDTPEGIWSESRAFTALVHAAAAAVTG